MHMHGSIADDSVARLVLDSEISRRVRLEC